MIGLISIAWSGHLLHVSTAVSRGMSPQAMSSILTKVYDNMITAKFINLSLSLEYEDHIYGSYVANDSYSLLTFTGGLRSDTFSLPITDITHHHLAIGILTIWFSSLASSLTSGVGYTLSFLGSNFSTRESSFSGGSTHFNLSISLFFSSVIVSLVAHHIYSLNPYVYLSLDIVAMISIYVHHQYIGSLLVLGSLAHYAIFIVRDYIASSNTKSNLFGSLTARILVHKNALNSHLSYLTLILGFHTLGLYVHNDCVVAFGESDKQILIEPLFGQVVLDSSATSNSLIQPRMPLTCGDLLAHHSLALGLHVTVLVLSKGVLDSTSSSNLFRDKPNYGYTFPCDGPGRGVTCDISSWDSFYLGLFWLLNTISWASFYIHWRHLSIYFNSIFQFVDGSTYLNGWFRDYLWFNSGALINGYNGTGANDLSVWSWAFLLAHLIWATSFKFLISWRGYWEELIETLIVLHNRTPVLYDLWNGTSVLPMAISIVEARFVGVFHFAVGFILSYASFLISSTS
jgi:photosystem I P700 chlorophyll a apoprotein A2